MNNHISTNNDNKAKELTFSDINIETKIEDDFYNIHGEWERVEISTLYVVFGNLAIVLILSLFGYIFDLKEIKFEDNQLWYLELCKSLLILLLFLHGFTRYIFPNIQVQYTRKMFHIITQLSLPMLAYKTYHDRKSRLGSHNILYYSLYQSLWSSFFINLGLLIMIKPIRKLDNIIGFFSKVSFLSIDRIEDRPYTLLWLILQISAVSFIESPMTIWLIDKNMFHLFWTPIFASGLGDGLAEIVGKKWGKCKYNVPSLFSDKQYTRTIEGSLCVYLFTTLGVLIGYQYFNLTQLLYALFIIPISVTIVEATSPHTWDNHFIFGIIWLNFWIIFDLM